MSERAALFETVFEGYEAPSLFGPLGFDAMTACNACEAAPMGENAMGYCVDCFTDAIKGTGLR